MKKFISLFLVMTIIIANINMPISYALSSNSNEVKVENNTISQTYEEKTTEVEKDEENNEPIDGQADTNVTTNLSDNKVESLNDDKLEDKKPSAYNNKAITVSSNAGTTKSFDRLQLAMSDIKNGVFSGDTVTVTFNGDYELDTNDITAMGYVFKYKHLIFTSANNNKVKIKNSFTLCGEDNWYVANKHGYIQNVTFQNIRLEFTDEHTIYTNGLWLHMGKNVEMIGDNYPNISAAGGKSEQKYEGGVFSTNDIHSEVNIFIESGKYSKIYITGGTERCLTQSAHIYFFNGYAKEIIRMNTRNHGGIMYIQLFGGKIHKIRDDSNYYTLNVGVVNEVNVDTIEQVDEVNIGSTGFNNLGPKRIGHLIINGHSNFTSMGINDKSIVELGEFAKVVITSGLWTQGTAVLRIPPSTDKNNVPMTLYNFVVDNKDIKLELTQNTNNTNLEDFYLLHLIPSGSIGTIPRSKFIVDEDEYFYLDEIEGEAWRDQFLKCKMKEKGPLIYDVGAQKFSYKDSKGNIKPAWWLENKALDLNEIKYNDLAKSDSDLYYVLAPSDITLEITGNSDNKTFKFNNDRFKDRNFNIVFKDLNATDSEFLFENIKSLTVEGKNSISNQNSTKTALKYSFSGNDPEPLKFDNDGSFTVYNKEKNTINNNIVNSGNIGNDSIVNISFEDDITTVRSFKLEQEGNTSNSKSFSTLNGYNAMSMLLVGDDKEYFLKENNNDIPYYYQSSKPNNPDIKDGEINGPIKSKIILGKKSNTECYQANNEKRVYVVSTQGNIKHYYLPNDIKKAMETYVAHTGGTHEVICLGAYNLTQEDSDAIKSHPNNNNSNGITFTTKVDDWTYSLTVGVDIEFSDNKVVPVTFKNIKLNYTADNKWIYGNGRKLTFAENVEMTGQYYPSISSGRSSRTQNTNTVANSEIVINSGTYKDVTGDRYNTLQNATIVIYDGTFKGIVSGVSNDATNNNSIRRINDATLTIKNGTFESKVYGVKTGADANGTLNMTIENGTFTDDVIAVDGRVGGTNATLTIKSGTFNSRVLGANTGCNIEQTLNMTIENGDFKNKVIGINGGTANNVTLIIHNGKFANHVFGAASNIQKSNFSLKNIFKGIFFNNNTRTTSLTGKLTMTVNQGTFNNEVQGVNSGFTGANIELNINGGRFNHNVVGTQAPNSILVMNISGGTFTGETVGQYTPANTISNSVTLNITNGDFRGNVRGASKSNDTTLNISGGTFGTSLQGDPGYKQGNATININGNITVPTIEHYDKLVVGEKKSDCQLTITNKIEANNRQDDELIIKNSSDVIFSTIKQSEVNKLTIEGENNSLTLNLNSNLGSLVVKNDYINNNKKLVLNMSGTMSDNKKLILFETKQIDINDFIFTHNDYYIKPVDNNSGSEINLYSKVTPNKLRFKLDLKNSTLEYSIDEKPFEKVWWYKFNLSSDNITFSKNTLLEYNGMTPFKNINYASSGDKVFELTNEGSNKTIVFDLDAGSNFDFELNNCKLTNSRLELKNLRNLKLTGSNSISEKGSDSNPAFSYQILGSVETMDNNSNLIVYTNKANDGIKNIGTSGYGAKFIFEDKLSNNKELKLKDENNNGVIIKPSIDCQKVSLLLPQSFVSKNLSLVDNNKQDSKYYFGDVVKNTQNGEFGYNIKINNSGITYNNVNNVPFIAISKDGTIVKSEKKLQDVITYINSNSDKSSSDYILTFMHGYELKKDELDAWKSWDQQIKSMTITSTYVPLNNKRYDFTIDGDLNLPGLSYTTTFNNINLKFTDITPWIYANGQPLVMGSGVNIIGNKPSISGGKKNVLFRNSTIPSATIEITSGNYKSIVGSTSPVTGNVNVLVSGSTNVEDFIKGCKSTVGGDVNITVRGNATTNYVIGSTSSVTGTLDILYGDSANITNSIVGSDRGGNDTTITINKHTSINEIVGFDNLVIGNTQQVNLSNISKLDKGTSNGNLTLKSASKISFKSNAQTAKLNDINVTGNNNTLVVAANASNSAVPVELSGTITGGKLNIELSQLNNNATATKTHLIKFGTQVDANVENKYTLPDGYYVRDEQVNGAWYAILYPQTAFDLKYNFDDNKLYKVENGVESEAWWYIERENSVTLYSDRLYKYKGYDLFKNSNGNDDRYITLTGDSSNKAFTLENNVNHVNVILDNINLTNSRVAVKNIKTLKLKGVNTINSINQTQNIFAYTFNNAGGNEKVLTENNQSYLKIFTNKETNPFNGSSATGIDFKFYKEFTSNDEVRLVENASGNCEFNFIIPSGTGRLGVLLGSSNKNKTYNLYHGASGTTGSSVYVCGNNKENNLLIESFEATSNNIVSYNYVRRANPVNIFNGKVSDQMSFNVYIPTSGLDGIKPNNWEQYFNATDMTIENNSRIVKDQFTDEDGVTYYFDETNANLKLGYMGVSPSENSNNDIKLVSKDEIDSNITNSSDGVKLALKFLDESCKDNLDGSSCKVHLDESCQVAIDETKSTTGLLKEWTIPSNLSKTLKIIPDFNTNNRFINANGNLKDILNSSHKFTFRFELQKP